MIDYTFKPEKEKIKLGLFIPFLAAGGAGRAVCRISELLADDYDLFLIVFDEEKIDFTYKGKIVNMDLGSIEENILKKLLRSLKRVRALKKIKKQFALDVVISFLDISNICNILSRTKSCRTVTSVRGNIYGYKADGLTDSIKKAVLSMIYRKSDLIIAVSKLIRKNLIRTFALREDRVITIYNPFDGRQIKNAAKLDIDITTKNFIKEKTVVLAVGQFVFAKGFWHLIKAFKQVSDAIPDAVLVICGEGDQKSKIERLIKDLHLDGRVILPGYRKNIFAYMNAADIFVLSSITEGFPNVLVEAMTCGLPVIAADCASGPREIIMPDTPIDESVTDIIKADYGILVPKMVPEENWDAGRMDETDYKLGEAMVTLLSDEALRMHYRNVSIKRAGFFDNETCRKAYVGAINQIINTDISKVTNV